MAIRLAWSLNRCHFVAIFSPSFSIILYFIMPELFIAIILFASFGTLFTILIGKGQEMFVVCVGALLLPPLSYACDLCVATPHFHIATVFFSPT